MCVCMCVHVCVCVSICECVCVCVYCVEKLASTYILYSYVIHHMIMCNDKKSVPRCVCIRVGVNPLWYKHLPLRPCIKPQRHSTHSAGRNK